jgi:hypothetical protein
MFSLPIVTVVLMFLVWPFWVFLNFLYGITFKKGKDDEWWIL